MVGVFAKDVIVSLLRCCKSVSPVDFSMVNGQWSMVNGQCSFDDVQYYVQ